MEDLYFSTIASFIRFPTTGCKISKVLFDIHLTLLGKYSPIEYIEKINTHSLTVLCSLEEDNLIFHPFGLTKEEYTVRTKQPLPSINVSLFLSKEWDRKLTFGTNSLIFLKDVTLKIGYSKMIEGMCYKFLANKLRILVSALEKVEELCDSTSEMTTVFIRSILREYSRCLGTYYLPGYGISKYISREEGVRGVTHDLSKVYLTMFSKMRYIINICSQSAVIECMGKRGLVDHHIIRFARKCIRPTQFPIELLSVLRGRAHYYKERTLWNDSVMYKCVACELNEMTKRLTIVIKSMVCDMTVMVNINLETGMMSR